jgi:hypothetical protein
MRIEKTIKSGIRNSKSEMGRPVLFSHSELAFGTHGYFEAGNY